MDEITDTYEDDRRPDHGMDGTDDRTRHRSICIDPEDGTILCCCPLSDDERRVDA